MGIRFPWVPSLYQGYYVCSCVGLRPNVIRSTEFINLSILRNNRVTSRTPRRAPRQGVWINQMIQVRNRYQDNDADQKSQGEKQHYSRAYAHGKNVPRFGAVWDSSFHRSRTSYQAVALFDSADGEAGDEAVEEQVVHERDGKTGDQAGGHQRSPVVDIPANQKDGDARPDHLIRFGREEGQGIDKFLSDEGEGEDDDGEDPGDGDGNDQLDESAEAGEAVHHSGVFQLLGNGLEETHEKPDGKGNREGGVDKD